VSNLKTDGDRRLIQIRHRAIAIDRHDGVAPCLPNAARAVTAVACCPSTGSGLPLLKRQPGIIVSSCAAAVGGTRWRRDVAAADI
jgi:hypothetical protein